MDRQFIAIKVSKLSIISNLLLTVFKLFAGIFAHSGAMISDAVHSSSDVFGSFLVIVGVRLAGKDADAEHPYGHERFECVTAILLAIILCITAALLVSSSIRELRLQITDPISIPGTLALTAACISILVKELLFRYTLHYAKAIDSTALLAEAWHHRSDALSSIGALIGIGGARLGFLWMEPAASLLICAFILKAAYEIFTDAVDKMVDHSCDEDICRQLRECVLKQDGVMGIDRLTTRKFGNRIYADVEIAADGSLTLEESHLIAEVVHNEIERNFTDIKHIMVHVNPYRKTT